MAEYKVGYRVKGRAGLFGEGTVMKVTPKAHEVIVLWDDEGEPLPPVRSLRNVAVRYTPSELHEIAEVIEKTEHPHGFRVGQRVTDYMTCLLEVQTVEPKGKGYLITYKDLSFGGGERLSARAMLNLMKTVRYKAR